jgi:hypothetical protein
MNLRSEINKFNLPKKRALLAATQALINAHVKGQTIKALGLYSTFTMKFPEFKRGVNLYNLVNHTKESIRNHERRNSIGPYVTVIRSIVSGRRERRGR